MNNINSTDPASYHVDLLAVGAHPDDVELSAGGTVAKMAQEGYSIAIVDFTRGEMGTRGTPEIRDIESRKAAEILGVMFRENLGHRDGYLELNNDSILDAVTIIRKYKPKLLLLNSEFERHPDHEAVHKIMRNAMFKSGLRKFVTELNGKTQDVHRIRKMFSYYQSYYFPRHPSFFTDISDTFDIKMNAIKSYSSQVWVPGISTNPDEPTTRLSRPEFLEELEARAIHLGTMVGFRYAEAFCSVEPTGISSLSKLI